MAPEPKFLLCFVVRRLFHWEGVNGGGFALFDLNLRLTFHSCQLFLRETTKIMREITKLLKRTALTCSY